MIPVIARNVLESLRLLAAGIRLLDGRCLQTLEVDVDRMRAYAEASPAVATALNRYLGYEEAAAISKQALREGRTVREVVVDRGHVAEGRISAEQLDEALDVLRMTRGSS